MKTSNAHIALKTQNLAIGYGSKKDPVLILEGINLALKTGKLTSLLGINGSGKSTLLRTLAGLQIPLSGKCELAATNVAILTPAQLATQLSVVLTGQPVSKNLSVLELVALGRQPYTNWLGTLKEKDKEIILQSLAVTETLDLKEKKCYTLSDGQMQRVLIARALAQDTQIILLDEPFTHLDLHHKASILKLLKNIVKTQRKAILFSTHDIELVLPLCDELIVIKNKHIYSGETNRLVDEGIFDDFFPKASVSFDGVNKRFRLS